jgi:predicted 3-demethylubiquinone-9 3-methyltransferase (glyoxalase superfamily)
MASIQGIVPCLWFDNQAEEAAQYYVSIFDKSRIVAVTRYTEAGRETHRKEPGSVLTVAFEIESTALTALNGGPQFHFNEAISLQVICETQEEIDRRWAKLTAGMDPKAQQCGWLRDKYGLSWQIVPRILAEMLGDPDIAAAGRVMNALMGMKKLDIAGLKQAHAG